MIDLIKDYLKLSEIALHNANLVYSIPALSNILAGESFKNFMLKEILTEEEARMHEEGWWYQHQLALLGLGALSNYSPSIDRATSLKARRD
ncbi:hypothetical protein [Thermocrinis sp.]